MLMAAAVALDAQEAVLQQPALQVVVEFLAGASMLLRITSENCLTSQATTK